MNHYIVTVTVNRTDRHQFDIKARRPGAARNTAMARMLAKGHLKSGDTWTVDVDEGVPVRLVPDDEKAVAA